MVDHPHPVSGISISNLEQSLHNSEYNDFRKQCQHTGIIKAQNEELSERNKKLGEELVRANAENEQLSERIKKLEESKAAIEELSERNIRLEFRNNKLEEELKKAEEQLESRKTDHGKTRNKLEELHTIFTAFKEYYDRVCEEEEEMGEASTEPSKKRKCVLQFHDVNDCTKCPLCSEVCPQSGDHNICSLSSGHFFGRSCITQWIKKNGTRGSSRGSECPLCRAKTSLKEIRNHCVAQSCDVEKII